MQKESSGENKIKSTSPIQGAVGAAAAFSKTAQKQGAEATASVSHKVIPKDDEPADKVTLSVTGSASQKMQALEQKQDSIYVDGDDKNNTISVKQNDDGSIVVNVDGQEKTYTQEEAKNLVIRGGAGNDNISIDDSVDIGINIEGGEGNDRIIGGKGNDKISGGGGRDYIESGAGDDTVSGGLGDDVIYGLDGNDTLNGDEGNDYIDGGKGNDTVKGSAGKDVLFGGRGDDTIEGGEGEDVLAGGEGKDIYKSGAGKDKIYSQDEDTIEGEHKLGLFEGLLDKIKHLLGIKDDGPPPEPAEQQDVITKVDLNTTNAAGNEIGSSITINGDNRFQSRTESDIDALRSIPTGRTMLTELDNSGHTVSIQETDQGNSMFPANADDSFLVEPPKNVPNVLASPGAGSDSTINYNPSRVTLGNEDWMQRPPIVGLYHEMVHSYNAATGTFQPGKDSSGTNNLENQAVGLPNSGLLFDHDNNPNTPAQRDNPTALTENGLRAELNLPRRPRY
jgi:hypothetical protein